MPRPTCSPERKQQLCRDFQNSSLSIRQFAELRQLPLSTLYGWVRHLPRPQRTGAQSFVPVQLLPETPHEAPLLLHFPGGLRLDQSPQTD